MLLAINANNTNVKFGLFEGERWWATGASAPRAAARRTSTWCG